MTRRAEKLIAALCAVLVYNLAGAALITAALFAWAMLGPLHRWAAYEDAATAEIAVVQPEEEP